MAQPALLDALRSLRAPIHRFDWSIERREFLLFGLFAVSVGFSAAPRWLRFGLAVSVIVASAVLLFKPTDLHPSLLSAYLESWSQVWDRTVVSQEVMGMFQYIPEEERRAVIQSWGVQWLGKAIELLSLSYLALLLLGTVAFALRMLLRRHVGPPRLTLLVSWTLGAMAPWIGGFLWWAPHSESLLRDGFAVLSIALDLGAALGGLALLPMGSALIIDASIEAIEDWRAGSFGRRGEADKARLDKLLERIHGEGGAGRLSRSDRRFLDAYSQRSAASRVKVTSPRR